MFEEKPDFSTSDLHELHDRKLRNQFMIEQNRECQSYFWDIFTQENYFVWVREVFHKSRIPTKLNLLIEITYKRNIICILKINEICIRYKFLFFVHDE